jgi:hypothetical protein
MLNQIKSLPQEITARVCIQSADRDGFNYLCWRCFQPETIEIGGSIIMHRDFPDTAFAHNPEPAPPKFLIDIL